MILNRYRHSGMAKNRGCEPQPIRHDPLLWLEQPDHVIEKTARNLVTRHYQYLWTIMTRSVATLLG